MGLDSEPIGNRHQPPTPINTSLGELLSLVKNTTDPWLLFLLVVPTNLTTNTDKVCSKGLFLSRLSRREEAIESLLLSIGGYPWNWSAWSLLGTCISDGEEVKTF